MKVVKKCCTITVDISNYLLVLSFDSIEIIQRGSEIVCFKNLPVQQPKSTLSHYDQPPKGKVFYKMF